MSIDQPYQQLSSNDTDLPAFPPNYEELESNLLDNNAGGTLSQMEEFEIEDELFDESIEREGFFVRASLMTKKFASNFNNHVIHPVSKIIDPMYEGYRYFNSQYERSILKLGNPLVVKRLLYILFVIFFMFLITRYSTNDGVNGASGGAFSSGKFYNIDKLGSSVSDYIDNKLMKENLEYLSSMPHITGSKGDLALSKYIERYMINNGINIVDFNELQSYANYPNYNNKETYVKLADNSFEATLFELQRKDTEYLAYNPNSLNTNDEVESFYLYGNYGTPEDFQKLKDNKIDLKDSILLLKYGGSIPEPNKIQLAQQNGVKAVIFITPEFEIGSGDSKVLHDDIIQNINVGLTRVSPGDVLTPGWSSEDGYVTRLPWFKSETTPKIPTIPISWKDGENFLSRLDKSGIKIDYKFFSGKSHSDNKIKLKITNEQRPIHQIWNVVGSIQGREQPEKGIIIGASRDASCFGTLSTNTGTVVLLEMVKIFTSLQRQYNWSPSRSIYFVSFDASQYNLAGSAEWIENRKESLRKEGYAYIDLSDAITGDILSIKSHPFLHDVIRDALKKVKTDISIHKGDHDDEKLSLYDLYKKQNNNDDISNNLIESKNYIPFINLINIPSLEIKFTGKKYPENSCYDNFENFEKSNIDSSMQKHKQLVELLSLITLNLAEAPIIPYSFKSLSFKLQQFENDLEEYINNIIDSLDQPNKPKLHLDGLKKSIEILKNSGNKFHDWASSWKQFVSKSGDIEPSLLAMNRWKWNDNMINFNENFIIKDIKPRRPGYVNILFGVPFMAPESSNNDHEWNTFPSIRDFLYLKDFGRAQHDINHLANLIDHSAQLFLEL